MPKTQKRRPFFNVFYCKLCCLSNHNNGVGKLLVIYPPYKFSGRPYYPRARGGCFTRGVYKGKYQIYVKLRFETLDFVFNDI